MATATPPAPVSFDPFDSTPAPAPQPAVIPQPAAAAAAPAAPAVTAQDFDLLGGGPVVAPPAPTPAAVPEPAPAPEPAPSPEEEVIMGMEGLSMEERQALIEEQRRIMAQIESEKTSNQASASHTAADAFDQRSNTYVAQVAAGARPTTSNFSGGAAADENAQQILDDAKLAEMLQNEEYARSAERRQQRAQQRRPVTTSSAPTGGESMWDTISNMFTVTEQPTVNQAAFGRPPLGGTPIESTSPTNRENVGLLNNSGGGGGGPPRGRAPARVAQPSQSIFACVADGAVSALNSVGTALNTTLPGSDPEGNVHGVDSSGLLGGGSSGPAYSQLPPR